MPKPQLPTPDVKELVAILRRMGSQKNREGMARYAIPVNRAFGISVGDLRKLAKRVGRSHDLALHLWTTGWYEARMLATFVDEPARVTSAQMDRWCRDFDSWAICDTACFHLFDRSPHAWAKVEKWATRKPEFERRAAFALLASLSLHDKKTDDPPFARGLVLVEAAAGDERNFVKKGVNWALRSIGQRSPELHRAAVELARHLSDSEDSTRRWVGKDALRELTSPVALRRVAAKAER